MTMPTQQELLELLEYDPLTGILIWKPRLPKHIPHQAGRNAWNTKYAGKPAFTADSGDGYKVGAINYILYRAHRIIFMMVYGYCPEFIDHEDQDRSNNRLTNLREATRVQNQQNCKHQTNNTSGRIGVSWNKQKNGWDAYIGINGKKKSLGRFQTMDEAIIARSKAEQDLDYHINHGGKAVLTLANKETLNDA